MLNQGCAPLRSCSGGTDQLPVQQCCIGRGLAAVRPRNGTQSKYILYYLRSVANAIDALGTGTTFKAVSGKVLRDFPFPLAPLPEQRRIVEAIELQLGRLDAAVARLHAAKAKLKRYKQAVLKAAVDDAIDNGKMFPLGDLITSIGQGWSPKCLNTPSPDDETWGVIKTTAIQPGAYLEHENKELPKSIEAET
ncbi:MAG: restriction endonuclease subunit S [Flavobacteriales bacterium]|nr:restriction endonuclease subunit S [Flavobacteriales bacterium]